MVATFVGGGSLRLIPVLREVFAEAPEAFRDGEIRLADTRLEAAEAVAALLRRTPEFPEGCRVAVTDSVEKALEGTGALYVTMAAGTSALGMQATLLCAEAGLPVSDQLSVNGAFYAAHLGKTVFGFARSLKRLSPGARMLVFANPVAVYAAAACSHAGVDALGICGGFGNHRWDLTRICFGRDEYDPGWEVVASGVNHMSFILRGTYRGRDLEEVLREKIGPDWRPMDVRRGTDPIPWKLASWVGLWRRDGTKIFSTEGDGMDHLFPDNAARTIREKAAALRAGGFDPEVVGRKAAADREALYARLFAAAKSPQDPDWSNRRDRLFGVSTGEISAPLFRAISGGGTTRIVASRPNRGAVAGFPDDAALEYTMDVGARGAVPVAGQFVPSPWKGLVAALSEFQTLLAAAVATDDPALFASALRAYPARMPQAAYRECVRRLFDLHAGRIPPALASAREMLG